MQDAIEPGSTVKPMVAAAALATDSVRPGERFDCRGRGTRLAGFWIRDHVEPGRYTLDEVVAYSANTGIIEIAERIPQNDLHRTFAAFGFGRRSGIDFPAEARGLMPEVRTWSKLSRAGFALGQELTVTPLQVALAYAAIANGGWLPEPCLVNSVSAEEWSMSSERPYRARVLDEALAARLTDMLEAVIEEGTGEGAQIPGLRVAGKTGTAQRAVNGGFDDEHHVAWFAGFLPLPDPRLVIVVAVENPRVDFWASTAAAPVFARIAVAAAGHLDLPLSKDDISAFRVARTDETARAGGGRVKLADLLALCPDARLEGDGDCEMRGITHDSRRVSEGDIFAALPGSQRPWHRLPRRGGIGGGRRDSERRGPAGGFDLPWIYSARPRREMAAMALALAGDPQRDLRLIGITGTNGKSTTASLIGQTPRRGRSRPPRDRDPRGADRRPEIGATERTTPESTDLAPILRVR